MRPLEVAAYGGIRAPLDPALAGVRASEEAGFDAVWWSDHFLHWFPPAVWTPDLVPMAEVVRSPHAFLDPMAVIAASAVQTERVRLGTAVTDAVRRHPAVLAQTFLTLDHLSHGRAMLGLGVGEAENILPFGFSYERRASRLIEAIEMIRLLWSTIEPVDYEGEFWTLDQAILGAEPYGDRPPEIWVAAHRPRVLRATGRLADGWLPVFTDPGEYGTALATIRGHAADAGRAPEDITAAVPCNAPLAPATTPPLPSLAPAVVSLAAHTTRQPPLQHRTAPRPLASHQFPPVGAAYPMDSAAASGGGRSGRMGAGSNLNDIPPTMSPARVGAGAGFRRRWQPPAAARRQRLGSQGASASRRRWAVGVVVDGEYAIDERCRWSMVGNVGVSVPLSAAPRSAEVAGDGGGNPVSYLGGQYYYSGYQYWPPPLAPGQPYLPAPPPYAYEPSGYASQARRRRRRRRLARSAATCRRCRELLVDAADGAPAAATATTTPPPSAAISNCIVGLFWSSSQSRPACGRHGEASELNPACKLSIALQRRLEKGRESGAQSCLFAVGAMQPQASAGSAASGGGAAMAAAQATVTTAPPAMHVPLSVPLSSLDASARLAARHHQDGAENFKSWAGVQEIGPFHNVRDDFRRGLARAPPYAGGGRGSPALFMPMTRRRTSCAARDGDL